MPTEASRDCHSLAAIVAVVVSALGHVGCVDNFRQTDTPSAHPSLSIGSRGGQAVGSPSGGYEAPVGQLAFVGVIIPDDRQRQCRDVTVPRLMGGGSNTTTDCEPVGAAPLIVSIDEAHCDDSACVVSDLGAAKLAHGGIDDVPVQLTGTRAGAALFHATAHLSDGRVASGTLR